MTIPLAFRESGSGTPVVLLHAFPLAAGMFAAQHADLAGVRMITPDLRGFGASPLGFDEPSLDRMADDVLVLLDRLGLETAVLGGVSMGGYVTMAVLRRHPERVSAVILADTKAAADPPAARQNRERLAAGMLADGTVGLLLDELVPALTGPTTGRTRPTVAARVRALTAAAPAAAAAWAQLAMAARPDSLELLTGLSLPALVVVGDEDGLTPLAEAERLAAALKSSSLTVIPAAGHLASMENPDSFNAAVLDFLAGL